MKSFVQQSVVQTPAIDSLRNYPARPARMRWFLLLLGLYLAGTAAGRAQTYNWTVKNSSLAGYRTQVAADNAGNTYVTTAFTGTITLGGATLKSNGGIDILLIKYKPDGAVQWARRIGSPADEQVGDVAVSFSGEYVYVTGTFRSTVKFDDYHGLPGDSFASAGGTDAFVARYATASGTFIWAKPAGGPQNEKGNGLAVDGSDNVYATGSFQGKAVFQTGLVPFSLTSAGMSDIFLTKYTPSGGVMFARRLGNTGADEGRAVALNKKSGEIYLTGGFAPPANLYIPDVLIGKFNPKGNLLWTRTAGRANEVDMGNDLIVSTEGVFVIGSFVGSLSISYRSVESKGSSDAFVIRLSSINEEGAPAWIAQYGGGGWDEGHTIAEHEGSIYIGGTFTGTATLGHTTLTALGGAGDHDLHVTRIYRDGTPSWSQRIGSTGPDYGRGGLAASPNNTLHFTGSYGGNAITLGSKTLNGAGNLLTRINAPTAPTVGKFQLINAATDATVDEMGTLGSSDLVNYSVVGSNKINIRAITAPAVVGSVIMELDGVAKTENLAPYTWAGDSPKNGGTDYHGFTPSTGKHTLVVSAYSGPKGTGVRSFTRTLDFFVIDAPVVGSLTLINAVTDQAAGTLSKGQKINYANLGTGQINVRANLTPGNVGSVKFVLDGVTKIDNTAPYTWAGDSPKDGGINYHAFTPAPGYHDLEITIHALPDGQGVPATLFETYFQVENGGFVLSEAGRLGAGGPEPETDGASLTAAPNPFTDYTTLTFTAPEDGPARLEVYSPAGTRVSLLFDGPVEAGKPYRCTFGGGSLPAGLYVGRLTTGHRVTHRKLLLGR